MAFNLQKVLRALLFSTNQPLSPKDIQAAFTRFHEQASLPSIEGDEAGAVPPAATGETDASESTTPSSAGSPPATELPETAHSLLPENEDPEIYTEVPSLVTATQIREAMDAIALELRASNTGLLLIEGSAGYRLVTHPSVARWVRLLRNEPPPVRLSQSALETLAVVAYRQPTTRTEIEHIRGVSAEAGINKLLERELVYIVGRADLPGRPLQYGTTDQFLEFIGIKSLDELPASDVLSHRQIDEWLQTSTNAKPPTDAEMGLPLEVGEGASPNFEPITIQPPDKAAIAENPEPTSTDAISAPPPADEKNSA